MNFIIYIGSFKLLIKRSSCSMLSFFSLCAFGWLFDTLFCCYVHFSAYFFPEVLFLHLWLCRWSLWLYVQLAWNTADDLEEGESHCLNPVDDHSSWRILTHLILLLQNGLIPFIPLHDWLSAIILWSFCTCRIFFPEHILSLMPVFFFLIDAHWLTTDRKMPTPSLYQSFPGQFL